MQHFEDPIEAETLDQFEKLKPLRKYSRRLPRAGENKTAMLAGVERAAKFRKKKLVHKRSKNIDRAIKLAKKRDHAPGCDGAHLFPRNCPFPRYRPDDVRFIVSMEREEHQIFDAIKDHRKRAEYLRRRGWPIFADRILWVIGDLEGDCP